MSVKSYIGKIIVLLVLIAVLACGGLLWFDYLGVVQAKKFFAPLYRLLGVQVQTGVASAPEQMADLDADRLAKRFEALDLRVQELDMREAQIAQMEQENQQIAQELEDRRISQEEREKTFNNRVKRYDDKEVNIEQYAQYLNGMVPQKAVDILVAMDDQNVIDVLRKCEEIAARTGTASTVAYWISMMPADRAATLQRKMAAKPVTAAVDAVQ